MNPSTTAAVAACELTKSYGRRRGIDGITFQVNRGQICGLLGPNGAGKTTTMRILIGLSRPDAGTAELLGERTRLAAPVLTRVGVAIDGPAFVPHLSGWRNLQLFWRASGRPWPPPALDESLDLAGLGRAIGRRVKTYSLGMRQRLMLAQALMGDPEVLVLDEPANGLDPGEVRALREYLRHLQDRGAAVLVSSHLLSEVEQLATHVVVMNAGVMLAAGPLADLIDADAFQFEVDNPALARKTLHALGGVVVVSARGRRMSVTTAAHTAQRLNQTLVAAGVGVNEVRAGRTLESAFLELVEGHDAAH